MLNEVVGLNWLYFDLNSYFATIEQQVNHYLRGKPIVVVPLLSDSTCAIAVSYEAKLKGIGIAPSKYLAKIAAEMKKPDGLSIIKPEDIPTKLFDLSLRDIPGIGHRMLRRLYIANIDTVEKLYECSAGHLQAIWGSIYGKKCWYLLRDHELSEYVVKNKVIGHSRILDPEIRNSDAARDVAAELILKAAKRLRDKALYSTFINLYIRTTNRVIYKSSAKISPACDNATILKQLLNIWDRLSEQNKVNSIYQVAVSLAGLIEKPRQLTFDEIGIITKKQGISVAMDNINNKYGKSVINLGIRPTVKDDPIAFSHIPGDKAKEVFK
ncbi:PolY domain-containing protein [Candidatus Megaera venefica]|uniref:DNA-directed DNA polymerase n=1 Tax=Candidatus Megaera venefica TaxID=2055910 RepID=A0ABU5NDW2_9RICK|nr:hypothetical protein [Candidatus Megaera venefica]MEA0971355.1 PolY domain-containing protein [Candidatus Megaera venefica]